MHVGGQRVVVDVGGRAGERDIAAVHDDHPVGDVAREGEVLLDWSGPLGPDRFMLRF